METKSESPITVETVISARPDKVWQYWTEPKHIMEWNNASDDWHTPAAENDLRTGGSFTYRMEAKDKSFGFDFSATYDEVRINEYIAYTLGDGRKVQLEFSPKGEETRITETFEPESANSVDMQRQGWQAILDNFKRYTESH